jgi:hypothetical protein
MLSASLAFGLRRSRVKQGVAWLLLALPCLVAGCEKARSSAPPPPDFAGTWDVTFDDALDVEFRVGSETVRARLSEAGGSIEFGDGGATQTFTLDCSGGELVCPSEVMPRELSLQAPLGTLDADGLQLAKPLSGMGRGHCVARPGSFLTGEVVSTPGSQNQARPEAVAVTSGRATIIVDGACFGAGLLPTGTEIFLSSGFTAAKR